MNRVNLNDLEWSPERKSPKGRYRMFYKDISLGLGARKGGTLGDPPLDVGLVRMPPGAVNYPKHAHTTQWEFYVVVAGKGRVNVNDETHEVQTGDCFVQPPGNAHQIVNVGEEDLVYYVIANNAPLDVVQYPDSGKWAARGKCFRMQEATYYDGEE
ncbi:MAG: cupin domain-containing protein [Candidatus Latescibacteria bacterium]|nr:cupin domain-containing protein [Candidatus Latescibacterota bacterium]